MNTTFIVTTSLSQFFCKKKPEPGSGLTRTKQYRSFHGLNPRFAKTQNRQPLKTKIAISLLQLLLGSSIRSL